MIATRSMFRAVAVSATLALMCVGGIVVFAAEAGQKKSNEEAVSEFVRRVGTITDLADVSIPERQRLLKDLAECFPPAQAALASQLDEFVRNALACVDRATSWDLGDREAQDALCQRIVLYCLPLAATCDVDLEYRLVSQIRLGSSKNLNASGQKVTGKEWQVLRSLICEYRFHLWRRIEQTLDPSWDPADVAYMNLPVPGGNYFSGVAPEVIKEPEIRSRYEAALEANRKKAERNNLQYSIRRLQSRYLPRLTEAIADAYRMQPVSDDDIDLLKAYLRVYVSDDRVRAELLEIAQSAAKGERGGPAKASSVGGNGKR